LVEEEGSSYMADNDVDSDEARVLRPLQAAAGRRVYVPASPSALAPAGKC
jgi:hypothetical protein